VGGAAQQALITQYLGAGFFLARRHNSLATIPPGVGLGSGFLVIPMGQDVTRTEDGHKKRDAIATSGLCLHAKGEGARVEAADWGVKRCGGGQTTSSPVLNGSGVDGHGFTRFAIKCRGGGSPIFLGGFGWRKWMFTGFPRDRHRTSELQHITLQVGVR